MHKKMGFMFSSLLVLLLSYQLVRSASLNPATETCQTADNQEGDCISLGQCLPLNKLLKGGSPTPQTTQFLKKSHCGFTGKEPKVCCPIGSTTINIPKIEPEDQLFPKYDSCGISPDYKIFYGETTVLDMYPWTALLEYQKPDGSSTLHCGGALISKRYVLTAAHCIKDKKIPKAWKLANVRLAEYDTNVNPECFLIGDSDCDAPYLEVPVETAIIHEDYNPEDINQRHDIALLRLKNEVAFNDFIIPICLPPTEAQTSSRPDSLLTGWGITETGSLYQDKRQSKVNVTSIDECKRKYSSQNVSLSEEEQLCVIGVKANSLCAADSGGALAKLFFNASKYFSWSIIGISSFGPSTCGTENHPGVFTNVAHYKNWIIDHVKP